MWKVELQRLADESGPSIRVCHYPPGTSMWNKIAHRLFSYIARSWRGQPLTSRQVVIGMLDASSGGRRGDPGHLQVGELAVEDEGAAGGLRRVELDEVPGGQAQGGRPGQQRGGKRGSGALAWARERLDEMRADGWTGDDAAMLAQLRASAAADPSVEALREGA